MAQKDLCWGFLSEVCLSRGQSQLLPPSCMILSMPKWGVCIFEENMYQLQTFSSAASNSTGEHICAYTHTHRMCSQGAFSLFFIPLNSTGGHRNNTGNKEWRQLPEGKDTFHEDSLINISWKQIPGNQIWMGKTESLGRWLNTTGHEWK